MHASHIEDFALSFTPTADFPLRKRLKTRKKPGVHARIIQGLMQKPMVWARISLGKKPMTREQNLSLATSLHTGSRFGLLFQLYQSKEDGHTYARFVGKRGKSEG